MEETIANLEDADQMPLVVGDYRFDCYYQRGALKNGAWKKSQDGDSYVAVCKCGRGVFGTSLDDAVEKLKKSYSILKDTEHFHWEDTIKFNVILGYDRNYVMGTIRAPELLNQLDKEIDGCDDPSPARHRLANC